MMNRLVAFPAFLALATAACGSSTESSSTESSSTDAAPTETGETPVVTTSPEQPIEDTDAPLGAGAYPIAQLMIEVTAPDGATSVYEISCLGDTATLSGDFDSSADTIGDVAADRMCLTLGVPAVQQRLLDGEPADRVCTEIFGSEHTAIATGTIGEGAVQTDFHRSNGCGIDDWDVLMSNVLPSASA